MAWGLVKHRDNFTTILYLYESVTMRRDSLVNEMTGYGLEDQD